MSLRRSARNVGKSNGAVTEVTESIYQKASENGTTKAAKPQSTSKDPSTPLPSKRQRRKTAETASPIKSIPFTPTPSGVGLIASSANVSKIQNDHMLDDLASLNQTRPANPLVTNAPVLKSDGDAIVVNGSPSKKRKAEAPPDVGSPLKKGSSTIDTLLKDAETHLIEVDKEFMGQQVSGAAAASIRKKFTALFSDTHPAFPSPAQVLTKDIPTLRTAGLSQRKAEYITGLAEKFASGEFTAEGLVSASDEALIEQLVAVRGLGRWSVEMFACFGLKRMDVFSTGDLGVQRGMAAYVGRDVAKLKNKGGKWKYMSEQEMLSIASKFSPYRSLFMWYMWRIADVETEVLE
ncbi:3-methyladenine DNA glycosylase [Curvularia kusanoi]|uniref:3-methyladenine DNA glycosylase n=1 Tax=Curvularia kusanoi TaxID=90978 RepID=A0A9P4W9U5_CURKU|nr:3-methyladenine DNA glycosylase [Curvularia kusanoi]